MRLTSSHCRASLMRLGLRTGKPGDSPNNRVRVTRPRGLYEPVSGFGQLWHGEVESVTNARQRLGWATDLPFNFNTSYQYAVSFPLLGSWMCCLRGPDGRCTSAT